MARPGWAVAQLWAHQCDAVGLWTLALKEPRAEVLNTFRPCLWCNFGEKDKEKEAVPDWEVGAVRRGPGWLWGWGTAADKLWVLSGCCGLGSELWEQNHCSTLQSAGDSQQEKHDRCANEKPGKEASELTFNQLLLPGKVILRDRRLLLGPL